MELPEDASDSPSTTSDWRNPTQQFHRLRDWASSHWLRNVVVVGVLLSLVVGTIVAWLYLASLAIEGEIVTVHQALAALDAGDLELAEKLAQRLRDGRSLHTHEAGGPLYVLGVVKATQANSQWSAVRRRSDYLIAARYLGESRAFGFPQGRAGDGLYLLGKSLLNGDEVEAGIQVLEESLRQSDDYATQIHQLLCDAHLKAPTPRLKESLRHNTAMLASATLADNQRESASLTRVQILIGLRQFSAAQDLLSSVPASGTNQSRRELLEGFLLLEQAREALAQDAASEEAAKDLGEAETKLLSAQPLDRLTTSVTRQAAYLHAEAALVRGHVDQAIQRFAEVRKLYPGTSEGIAAALRESELLLQRKAYDAARNGYRRTLQALSDPKSYRNPWLPLVEIQRRIIEAQASLVAAGQFPAALEIADHIVPLFSRERQLALRAQTQEEWGKTLLFAAADSGDPQQLREGRLHRREAGVSFEELARLRFATRRYADDLWRSAENFFEGQSYTRAAELLNEYLNNEPQRRNAQTLLQLGQCLLALGKTDAAIAALEECIEFQPYDAAVYQARLDCARAYRSKHDLERAEALLLENIAGGGLTPQSPEWRASQFELGHLLHEAGRFLDAVKRLEEAVERYPDDPQSQLARYLIAESYRHAATQPLEAVANATAVSEREANQSVVNTYLEKALQYYGEVQREIAARGESNELDRVMRRNCYLLQGSVLFDLERYKEAVEAYSNVATLYQNEPFVLETLVQIAHCWNRLNDDVKAHGQVQQAKLFLERLPSDADFVGSTNLTRQEWQMLLDEMSRWWQRNAGSG